MKAKLLVFLLLLGGVELRGQTIVQQFVSLTRAQTLQPHIDISPTRAGSLIIVMPGPLSSDIKVVSVTDNATAGDKTYKQVDGAASSSTGMNSALDIWYCEKCKGGATEIKINLSAPAKGSMNAFLEVANMASSSALDGSGVNLTNGTGSSAGLEVGPSLTTTATDFIIARYVSTFTSPTGVTPAAWTYKSTYVYIPKAPAGTYQPTLTGASPAASFCMSMAAFKIAASVPRSASGATKHTKR
jgi:hypothetical protein